MTDIIADAISQGVDLLITAVILSAVVAMLSTATTVNAKINEQQAMNQQIVEWRQHNQYNGTTVYAQDVMSAILGHRGNPYVTVKYPDTGATYTWSVSGTSATDYTYTAVSTVISASYVYKGELRTDVSGVVIGYEFIATIP